jgi:uncharacterized protein
MRIVVLAKEPRPGFVKTRLCPPCTQDQAAAIALAGLVQTLETVLTVDADERVLALDGNPGPWLAPGYTVIGQQGHSLGDRLSAVMQACRPSPDQPVLVVGMDTPQATRPDIEGCASMLSGRSDAVLGPAVDGGYWLIGMNRFDHRAFAGVPMSTAQTGTAQQAQLERCGFRVHRGPVLRDVDTADDARAVAAAIPGTTFAVAVNEALGPPPPPVQPPVRPSAKAS